MSESMETYPVVVVVTCPYCGRPLVFDMKRISPSFSVPVGCVHEEPPCDNYADASPTDLLAALAAR
jgi:hypothetical protein